MTSLTENPEKHQSDVSEQLIDVFEAEIDGTKQQVVNARTLHGYLEVGRDFTNWIKSRITKYGFQENLDYSLTLAKTGVRSNVVQKDYLLTLDVAKELSMVENNDKGRAARRYFIRCEKAMYERIKADFMQMAISTRSTITPEQKSALRDIVMTRANGNKSSIIEMWARHNRHFNINSYHELLAVHFDDACNYLSNLSVKAKIDNNPLDKLEDFLENLSKRYPNLSNPIAYEIAQQVAKSLEYYNPSERLVYWVAINQGKVVVQQYPVHYRPVNVVKLAAGYQGLQGFLEGSGLLEAANNLKKLPLGTIVG